MSRLDELTPHPPVSTRRPEHVTALQSGDRIPSERIARDLILTDTRQRSSRPPSHDDAPLSAVEKARRDLRTLKATVQRLTDDCEAIVQCNDVHAGDAPTSRNRGRDALHLRARADAVAALIQETERVLDHLEAQG